MKKGVIDFIFSEDLRKYLLIIVALGAFLRYIVASHVSVLADEMLHGPHAINIIKAGVINLQNQSPAWFYLTDVFYNLFGVTAASSRSASLFFGIFTILLVYLIGEKLYSKKIGLIASLLLATSAFTIRYTLMEMDIAMMFFILLGFYFFVENRNKISYLVPVSLGIAVLIKAIALPFIAGFVTYFFFLMKDKENGKKFLKENGKRLIVCGVILLLFTTPVLAYNYLLYKEKGITDVLFARFLKINPEIYAPLQGYDKSFELSYLINPGIKAVLFDIFLALDPILFIIGIIGIIIVFRREEQMPKFFVTMHLLVFLFLMGTSLLQTHFVSFVPLLALMSAVAITSIADKFGKNDPDKIVKVSIGLILLVSLFLLIPNLTSQSAIFKLREYSTDNFNSQDVIITDGRIYSGRVAWMLHDQNFLYANYFAELIENQKNLPGSAIPTTVYFVECVPNDCGWGTIKDQPEYNQNMENIVDLFKSQAQLVKTIYGGGGYDEVSGKPYFNVYKAVIPLKSQSYPMIQETHDWFYYPVAWGKDDWYDKYTPVGAIDVAFNGLGKLVLWLAVILALILPWYVAYLAFRKN